MQYFYFIMQRWIICSFLRHTKDSIGTALFQKESDINGIKSGMSIIEFRKFKAAVGQREIDCKYKT